MQLKAIPIALAGLLAFAAGASGQSLSPMQKTGVTPSDVKGFRLIVGNPYGERMTFVAVPMDPTFTTEVGDAAAKPAEFRLAPGASRPVVVQFRITGSKERTIGLCIYPKDIEGPVLPRVCGRYTGRKPG